MQSRTEHIHSTFATIFTPQGDGNVVVAVETTAELLPLRYDIYPARGRKQIRFELYDDSSIIFATIFTPQGDGNYCCSLKHQTF